MKKPKLAGRWQAVQVVRGVKEELLGSVLWMRMDTMPCEIRGTAYQPDIDQQVESFHGHRILPVNLVQFINASWMLAGMTLCQVLPLNEWTDTPPLYDNMGWAEWAEKRPIPKGVTDAPPKGAHLPVGCTFSRLARRLKSVAMVGVETP